MLNSEIYLYIKEFGSVGNEGVLDALEGIKGLMSKIYVPGGEALELTNFLSYRMENSPRYNIAPAFSKSDRQRIVDELIAHIRSNSENKSYSYEDDIDKFYSNVDFIHDLNYNEEELRSLKNPPDSQFNSRLNSGRGDDYNRSEGGVILPG